MQALLPRLRHRALAAEMARRVPAETIEELRAAGLYKLVQPAAFGGHECDFVALAEVIMDMAAACASTAWVCGLLAGHQWLAGLFPRQAQEDVWQADPAAVLCGSYAPINTAVADGHGWRLDGRWSFASGCDSASWAICAARLPPSNGLPAAPVFFLVPARDLVIDDDWHVNGLAGTGSKTMVLRAVHVPGHRMITFADAAAGRAPGSALYANRLFAVPVYCHVSACLAATAVGAAAGAVGDFVAATASRVTRGSVTGGNNLMAEIPTVQIRLAQAAAEVDAARTILLRDLADIAREVRERGEATREQRITNRRGQAFAVGLALRAVEALNALGGGNGLALSSPVQRAWRDVNAVARHVSLNWDAVGAMYGQMALGLEPRGQY